MQMMTRDAGGAPEFVLEQIQNVGSKIPERIRLLRQLCDQAKQRDDLDLAKGEQEVKENNKNWAGCGGDQQVQEFKRRYQELFLDMMDALHQVEEIWTHNFQDHVGAPSNMANLAKAWDAHIKVWETTKETLAARQSNHEWKGPAADLYHYQLRGQQQATEEMIGYTTFTRDAVNQLAKIHAVIFVKMQSQVQEAIDGVRDGNSQQPPPHHYGARMAKAKAWVTWLIQQWREILNLNSTSEGGAAKQVAQYMRDVTKNTKAFKTGRWPKATDEVAAGAVHTGNVSDVGTGTGYAGASASVGSSSGLNALGNMSQH